MIGSVNTGIKLNLAQTGTKTDSQVGTGAKTNFFYTVPANCFAILYSWELNSSGAGAGCDLAVEHGSGGNLRTIDSIASGVIFVSDMSTHTGAATDYRRWIFLGPNSRLRFNCVSSSGTKSVRASLLVFDAF